MPDCIFCKIANKEISTEKVVYEDEKTIAFLDVHPQAPGHTLLIPKVHYQWFDELPDEVSDSLFRAAKHIAREMKKDPKIGHVQLSIVGKDVPHVHIHLIPRIGMEGAVEL